MICFLSLFLAFSLAKVRISEIVPHSDVEDGYYDYIELWNDDDKPADISGHFLTDSGSKPTKCQIKAGTILAPGQHKSFSFQAPGDVVPLVADCPFRLSKVNEHCYYGKTDNGQPNGNYTLLDDMNIGATMNRLSNSLWFTKDSKKRHMITFPTENYANRYPIVGPLSIQEVVWDVPAGKLQWIKYTCLYGQYPNSYTSPCRMSNRQGTAYRLRLAQQKDLFTDTNAATPVSLSIPTTFTLPQGSSVYLTNGDPDAFRQMYAQDPRIEAPLTYVFGPWIGDLVNKTSKDVFCGISTLEHSGDWWTEQFEWKFNDTDYERPPANGGLKKLSKHGTTAEPDNWIGLGQFLPCNLTAELPQSDCPTIDKCTAAQCVNVSGVGQCQYNSLACNHPNFDACYPMQICKLPAPDRYNGNKLPGGNPALGGCYLTNQVFGHQTADALAFGMYPPYPESMWYNVGCTRQAIDCDLSKWGKWNYCPTCDARYNQTRIREIKTPASKNPDGKCAPLSQTRSCGTTGVSDIVCGRVQFKYVNWGKRWVDLYNPSNAPLDISDWVLRQGPCTELNYPANDTYVDFKSNTVLLPGDTIRKDLKNVVLYERGVKNNVICLHEVTGKGRFTGSWISFDESEHVMKSLHS